MLALRLHILIIVTVVGAPGVDTLSLIGSCDAKALAALCLIAYNVTRLLRLPPCGITSHAT